MIGAAENQQAEFSRTAKLGELGSRPHAATLKAGPNELTALAARFDCLVLDALTADLEAVRTGETVRVTGRFGASGAQRCVATGDPVPFALDEPVDLTFLPLPRPGDPDEEVELGEDELDTLFHDGRIVDWGEAVAQSLGLALDPYPRSPQAAEVLAEAGVKSEDEVEPIGALSGLKALLEGRQI
ncbi:YceD family protein [Novosphingopyxis sp.]|uniref:YceD family protein n=1 Tax=Novosphingopyxis sp. TaxID=2709690 RepID=UPI003B5B9158